MLFYILILSTSVANVLGGWECDDGWRVWESEEICIMSPGVTKTYQESLDYCIDEGAVMSRPTSQEKNQLFDELVDPTTYLEGLWVPIDATDPAGVFIARDGGGPWTDYRDFQNHAYYKDLSTYPDRKCVMREDNAEYFWENKECDLQAVFACQKDANWVADCDDGWHHTPKKDSCLKVVAGRKRNFAGAIKHCEALGGDLATSITTWTERSRIMDLKRFRGNFWIGVHAPDSDQVFKYVDGTLVVEPAPFKKGRPKSSSGNDCVSLKQRKWFDRNCNRWLFFVCQKTPPPPGA